MPDMPVDHYPAREFARAWLTVFQAAATGKDDRITMRRAVTVETFPEGARITATDSYVIATAWVPNVDHAYAKAPDPDVDPERSEIVSDVDQRGAAMMKYVVQLTVEETDDDWVGAPAEVTVQWNVDDPDDTPVIDDTLATKWVALSIPDRERVHLATLGLPGLSSAARIALAPPEPTGAAVVGMNLDLLHKVVPMRRWHRGCPIRWSFTGPEDVVAWKLYGSDPAIHGALMPMRLGDYETRSGDAGVITEVTITGDSADAIRGMVSHAKDALEAEDDQ